MWFRPDKFEYLYNMGILNTFWILKQKRYRLTRFGQFTQTSYVNRTEREKGDTGSQKIQMQVPWDNMLKIWYYISKLCSILPGIILNSIYALEGHFGHLKDYKRVNLEIWVTGLNYTVNILNFSCYNSRVWPVDKTYHLKSNYAP